MHHIPGDNIISASVGGFVALIWNTIAKHELQSFTEAFMMGIAGAAGGLFLKYLVTIIIKKTKSKNQKDKK